jgi:chitodextrinase
LRLPVRPGTPAGVRVTPTSPTEVTVEWQPSTGDVRVTGYEVRGGEDAVRTAAERARLARLAPRHRYCFAVTALGAGDLRSEESAPVCVETPPDVTPPEAPAGLVAQAQRGEVRLRWSPARDDVGVEGYEVLRGDKVVASGSATSAHETGLRSAEHCYAVRAYDAAGNRSALSAQACATPPDVTPPTVPAKVVASAKGEGEVEVAWAPSTDDVGVAGYAVTRERARVAEVPAPPAREAGLRAATRYCYRVVARDIAGNHSAPSEPACVTTPDRTAPSPPAHLVAAAAAEGRVALAWSPAEDNVGVAGYEVWRGKYLLAKVGTATTYADDGPKPSAETCYTVRAFDAAGNRSPASAESCAPTPDLVPPSAPADVAAAPASPRRMLLSWSASTDNIGVAGYEVLRDGKTISEAKATSAAEDSLEPLREYCYSVRAVDAAGNRSRASARACARTPDPSLPLPPANLVAVRTGTDEIELRWDRSPTAGVVYIVTWDGASHSAADVGKARSIGTTPLTRLKVFGQAARERHCYRVLARLGTQDSPETLPLCVGGASAITAR